MKRGWQPVMKGRFKSQLCHGFHSQNRLGRLTSEQLDYVCTSDIFTSDMITVTHLPSAVVSRVLSGKSNLLEILL
jgi:hypothetical protein